MPHARLMARIAVAALGLALASCGDRETLPDNVVDAQAISDPLGNVEASAIEANSMQTSAQSNALTTADPQRTAGAGNSILTE